MSFDFIYKVSRPILQNNGFFMTNGFLMSETGPILMWHCVSGKYGRGTIPIGIYEIKKPIRLEDTEENNAYKGEGVPWYAKLIPLGDCSDSSGPRTGLALHPDGNLEGTLGCVGVTEKDMELLESLEKMFDGKEKNGGIIRLAVC